MLARVLSILLSLSVFLPSPAMAQWNKSDGFRKKPKKSAGYDDDYGKGSNKNSKQGSSQEDATASDAEEEPEFDSEDGSAGSGAAFGARLGFGLPFGKLGEGGTDASSPSLSDLVSGGFPAQLDAGYFIDSNLYVGGFFQYGLMMFADECPADCSASQLRFGLNAAYSFKPEDKVNPWLGLGIGYEMLNVNVSSTVEGVTFKIGQKVRGLEFANLQGGVDFRIGKSLWVGPYTNFTVGQYSNMSLELGDLGGIGGGEPGDEDELSGEIPEKALHFWLMGGVRILFRL